MVLAHWKDVIVAGFMSGDIVTLDGITGSQGAVLSGHTDWVASLSFSSDGTLLVSGSGDETLKLWDVQTGGVVKTFHCRSGSVHSVSISPNCTTIASGSQFKGVHLWDIGTGKCYRIIEQQAPVECVSFSPTNPQHLIFVSGDVVQWWDVSGCKVKPPYKGHYFASSLDGTHFAVCGGKATTVQNSDSGAIVANCPIDTDAEYCCFSPNGKLVAIASGRIVFIWDITGSDPHLIETFGHAGGITSLTFSSSSLISASAGHLVQFWQISASLTGTITSDLETASILSVSLQAESGIAISGNEFGMVRIWDISTGLCKALFQTPVESWVSRDARMIDGRLVVVWLWEGRIHIWDTENGELLQVMKVDSNGSTGDLKISGDGSKVFLLVGKSIQAWSMWTGEVVGEVKLEDDSCPYLFQAGSSKICRGFHNSSIQGWDFGVSGSSPVPLPNPSSERPGFTFIGGVDRHYSGVSWIKDIVTGREVFRLSGRYASPYAVQWDGRYLVAGYRTGEVLILDFNQMLPQ
jgi:WD40 repeat protein